MKQRTTKTTEDSKNKLTRRDDGAVVGDEPPQPRGADRRRPRPPQHERGGDEAAGDEEREDAVGQGVQGGNGPGIDRGGGQRALHLGDSSLGIKRVEAELGGGDLDGLLEEERGDDGAEALACEAREGGGVGGGAEAGEEHAADAAEDADVAD